MAVIETEAPAATGRAPAHPGLVPAGHRSGASIGDHAILIAGSLFMLVPVLLALITSTHDAVTIHRGPAIPARRAGGRDLRHRHVRRHRLQGRDERHDHDDELADPGPGVRGRQDRDFDDGGLCDRLLPAALRDLAFWAIFTTLLLPLEVRILPSYEIVHSMGLTNTYTGLILPLIASATGTFFFRQFFKSVPDELLEAARIDGAGPWKFFIDILVPLSRTMIAAIFIIMFVFGWNQYLWPTLITTDEGFFTLVRGIKQILNVWVGANIPEYAHAMAMAILAMIPPVVVVVLLQSWFIKGLTESDK